jgi:hypothetical protein
LVVTSNARGQELFTGVDGCAVLAQLVYSELTEAAWYGSSEFRPWTNNSGETKVTICNQTTRTVSKAFTAAMTSIGSDIRWGNQHVEPGDYCLSGFLEQCYPGRYPIDSSVDTWIAVSKTVQQAMPNGTGSDQSVFSSEAMRLALRSALARR